MKQLPRSFPKVVVLLLVLALFLLAIGNSPIATGYLALVVGIAVLLACWFLLYRFARGVPDNECGDLVHKLRCDAKRRQRVLVVIFACCAASALLLALSDAYALLDVVPLMLWNYAFVVTQPM